MTTDFRALCAELIDQLKQSAEVHWHYGFSKAARQCDAVVERASAALSDEPAVPEGREPASVTGQPSDKELWDTADLVFQANTWPTDAIRYARDVLARWGCSKPAPNKPTVMQIIELADEVEAAGLGQVDLVRAALTRWGTSNLSE